MTRISNEHGITRDAMGIPIINGSHEDLTTLVTWDEWGCTITASLSTKVSYIIVYDSFHGNVSQLSGDEDILEGTLYPIYEIDGMQVYGDFHEYLSCELG